MPFASDDLTPSGKTWGQIWAEKAEYVKVANAALALKPEHGARWWRYCVSHRTFEMVVGDPLGKDNIVLSLSGCEHLAGPICWSRQQLEVTFGSDPGDLSGSRKFTLQDASVAFRAVGSVFRWRTNYDIVAHHGLYLSRGGSSAKLEEILQSLEEMLREYYEGQNSYDDLEGLVNALLWNELPVVKSGTQSEQGRSMS